MVAPFVANCAERPSLACTLLVILLQFPCNQDSGVFILHISTLYISSPDACYRLCLLQTIYLEPPSTQLATSHTNSSQSICCFTSVTPIHLIDQALSRTGPSQVEEPCLSAESSRSSPIKVGGHCKSKDDNAQHCKAGLAYNTRHVSV